MRIVILRSNPVNPDSRVEKEANSLIKAGHHVTIVGWDRDNQYDWRKDSLALPNGVSDIYRIGIPASFGGGMKNLKALFNFSLKLWNWLSNHRNEIDCIHACDLDTGLVAMNIARRYCLKYVYDIFDYYAAAHHFPKWLEKWIIKAEEKVINNAVCTILCTNQRREQIKNSKPKRIVVIHNSPSETILNKTDNNFKLLSSDSKKIKIGYVGILSKNRLLEQIAHIVSQDERLELHIGGFGLLAEYFNDLSKCNNNIFFYGKLPYSETLKLEKNVDILTAIYDPAVPNHKYAAPNKFYESLMLGKPVIMIHGTGVDHIIDTYQIGTTIDYSEEGFRDGINKLIDMRELWNEIGIKEQELFSQKYSWFIMEKRLLTLYSEI